MSKYLCLFLLSFIKGTPAKIDVKGLRRINKDRIKYENKTLYYVKMDLREGLLVLTESHKRPRTFTFWRSFSLPRWRNREGGECGGRPSFPNS